MTLLQKRDQARRERRLQLYREMRRRLRSVLHELMPGQKIVLFGSLTRPGAFNDRSDIDIALESEPPHMDSLTLISKLMEVMDRPVDLVFLDRCRFRGKILREGEVWML